MAREIQGSVLTEAGRQLIGKLLAAKGTLTLSRAVVGDGELPDDQMPELVTEVIRPRAEATVAELKNTGAGEATIVVQISSINIKQGFFISEVGVYAEDPDGGEVLYAYVPIQDHPEWMRPENSAINKFITFDIIIIVDRVESIVAIISPDAFVTKKDLERYALLGHRHVIPDVEGLEDWLLRLDQGYEMLSDILSNDIEGATQFAMDFDTLDGIYIEEGIWDPDNKWVYA